MTWSPLPTLALSQRTRADSRERSRASSIAQGPTASECTAHFRLDSTVGKGQTGLAIIIKHVSTSEAGSAPSRLLTHRTFPPRASASVSHQSTTQALRERHEAKQRGLASPGLLLATMAWGCSLRAALVYLAEPTFAALYGYAAAGRVLSAMAICGAGLILAANVFVEGLERRRRHHAIQAGRRRAETQSAVGRSTEPGVQPLNRRSLPSPEL